MSSTADANIIDATKNIKSFIYSLGIDIVGIAELSELGNIPVGLTINLSDLFKKYPFAIVIGAQHGKIGKSASGDETAVYLEKITYDIMGYLEKSIINTLLSILKMSMIRIIVWAYFEKGHLKKIYSIQIRLAIKS